MWHTQTVHLVGMDPNKEPLRFARFCKVFGSPEFIHKIWDNRAKFGGEFDPRTDVRIFAKGSEQDEPSEFSFDDSAFV